MPRRPAPPPAPASARVELNAALDALGLNLASGFGCPADRPPGLGTAPTLSARELKASISEHLDAIGLDDLTHNQPKQN